MDGDVGSQATKAGCGYGLGDEKCCGYLAIAGPGVICTRADDEMAEVVRAAMDPDRDAIAEGLAMMNLPARPLPVLPFPECQAERSADGL